MTRGKANAATMTVHPVAALFPMIPEDELRDMADSIKAIGLLHPLVTDAAGKVLLEGRNRLAACHLAGVQPTFEPIAPGLDPVEYILAENIARRHLNKGQRAMLIVEARKKFDRSNLALATEAQSGKTAISEALAVRDYAPELVQQVIDGGSLRDAYNLALEAKQRKADAAEQARNAEKFERELQTRLHRQYAQLKLTFEEIGPPIPIREQPELETERAGQRAADRAQSSGEREIEAVKRQREFVQRLNRVVREVRDLADFEPAAATGGWSPTLTVIAIRAAVSQIVDAAYQIAETHNRAVEEGRLRALPKEAS